MGGVVNQIEQLISLHEGYRQHPYKCPAGALTIGYGRNLDDNGITRQEALELLRNDIERARQDLMRNFPHAMTVMDAVRKAVLTDMCFNLGWPRLAMFTQMWSAIENGDWRRASDEMLISKWAEQVGARAVTLARMMRTGQWPVGID